jgi:hypothetical protein
VRLLIDEDSASKELVARLEGHSHQVVPPVRGVSDERCWDYAQGLAVPLLTMNAKHFIPLAENSGGHHGLLLVYRHNDPSRDMTAAMVATAVQRIDYAYPGGVLNLILSVNQFRW